MAKRHVPYISASRTLPELTVKAIVLGVLLSIILGAANTYLGLRVGLTVSASIPAAVISMGILRFFKKRNILENNAVQTAASAGESLAAGVLFTIPALLILEHWTEIHYLETTLVALTGGILGVFWTVPLRRALIVEAELTFPEGVATSEVLKAGEGGKDAGLAALGIGALGGALFTFMAKGLNLWKGSAVYGTRIKDSVIAFGTDLSPALIGVGYIIGLRIASLVFLGGVIGWLVSIPLYSAFGDGVAETVATLGAVDAAGFLWSTQIRYMGVGAMLVGGFWSLIQLRGHLVNAVKSGFQKVDGTKRVSRTQQELSPRTTNIGVAVLTIPLAGLYWAATGNFLVALVLALLMLVLGFLFSAVGAYMAGLVGSSNNPISGVTILTVLAAAIALRLMGVDVETGPAAAILVAAVIASAAAIGSDNTQDLKAGYLLGATPRKQQIMQVVGVTAAALTVALTLNVLTKAYELGSEDLAAPQAELMAAVAGMVFGIGELPALMVTIGVFIAIALILLDKVLEMRGASFRTPVMPVAVGIYLPVGLSAPIFLGGLVAWATGRWYLKRPTKKAQGLWANGNRHGVLFSSGLIAGEALVGILIAALVATVVGGTPVIERLYVADGDLRFPGLALLLYLVLVLVYVVVRPALMDRSNSDGQP